MLMLITVKRAFERVLDNFNTSHVNVNRNLKKLLYNFNLYFNTSHVNVNLSNNLFCIKFHIISIHLMLMLICFGVCATNRHSLISIHLMLMLILLLLFRHPHRFHISIHLMLMLIRHWCGI